MKNIENTKETFKEFKAMLFIAFDVLKDSIVKQEIIKDENEEIMITLIKLPDEFLYKKEVVYIRGVRPGIMEEVIKPYSIIVFRMKDVKGIKQPLEKLDYGNYSENKEKAFMSFEKVKEEIYKDINR